MADGNPTSPLFWKCKCDEEYIHFTDDDTCSKCGMTEGESPHADIGAIRKFFPFIPVEKIPQETESGIVFTGDETVHPLTETGSCAAVEDAFFEIRALIREHYADEESKS